MRALKPEEPATPSLAGIAAAILVAGALAGCGGGAHYASSDPVFPGNFQARHPIALVDAPATIEVYPTRGGLDSRTIANLKAFAGSYRALGSGEVVILLPATRPDPEAAAAIRRTLAGAGVSGRIALRSYAPPPHASAPPIRVAFMSLEARVATPCGNWPEDLASGASLEGWKNEPYANLGCASQSVLAAEVADPRDFVEPRASGPADVNMRMRAIEAVRDGKDPGTAWKTDLLPIGADVNASSSGGGGG